MKEYYNAILNKEQAESIKRYLKENHIYYEASSCGDDIYFSIKATQEQAENINQAIERGV